MHAIEKILAKNSGKNVVKTGEIVTAKIDFAEVNDLYLQTIYSFREMNGKKVWDKERLAFVFDHYAPAPTIKSAQIHKEMREFANENDLTYHFDINAGVCHQVMPEAGLIYPGAIVVATDSHTTTHGAFGAMGTGVGATDMATIMISGELWFRVPEIIEIRIDGTPKEGVMPKDVVLYLMGKIKADGAVYKAIDFTGSYIEQLDVPGRMVLCNMAVEMGAKTAYMQPNQKVLDYVNKRAVRPFEVQCTDDDFVYSECHKFDISDLTPQVAVPHSVDNVFSVDEVERIKVNQCFIGTCTGGRTEDIKAAADILRGKKISDNIRLIVIPASTEVMMECMKNGYLQDCINAGAAISTPGCGPCLSAHEGVLAPGEVCVTASNRNFPGRMGSNKSKVFLASPATVAATALTGYLTNPCNLKQEELWKIN
ncbi:MULTISPECIES: 3-isopropylmalate dehydratase large subunit [unclassified Sedimentibacter]|uniref:3-isopropylmalate dehydratase large subunit n=1 Tax=unclassified Sedimentibacter TaxID=2649220 RepID=UPI0027E0C101|nr:3-isopropylmalate dehydratase large subunit [Sedimentibacter sp. MB35-C1]WMJ77221.1 3-isopropylmalate dehydratase large subunit [Sedimentibacter sp. MB35-C1]